MRVKFKGMRAKLIAVALGLGACGFATVFAAPAASAHNGMIQISCSAVTFSYDSFPSGTSNISETVSVNGTKVVSKTFTLTGSAGSDTVAISAASGDTVSANATWTADGGGSASLTQQVTGCSAPCPQGTKANFRWHYSANGSSGSWSGTKTVICPGSLTQGPQAMEGDLKVSPGTTLEAGYDFTVPGNKASFSLTVTNPQVVFTVNCVSGATPSSSTLTVPMPTTTYSVINDQWIPSGDQHSPLVYQGSITVPDLCGGGQLRLNQGGTFTASVS